MASAELTGEVLQESKIKISKKKQILFAAAIFIVFLLSLEGAFRLLGVEAEGPGVKIGTGLYRESNKSFRFEYTPGWDGVHAGGRVHINSAGWRGKDFSPIKPPGTIRILGIGDSVTFGRAVDDEDVFLRRLEEMLNSDGSPHFETINTGHEGLKTVDELQYFKDRGMMNLNPDAIVLGFTVSNDAEETPNRRAYRRLKRNATLSLRISESDWFKRLSESSRIARVLQRGALWISSRKLSQISSDIILSNFEDGSKSWEDCRNALLGFYEISHQNKVPLILVLFPDCESDLNRTFREYPEDFRRVHEKLKAVFSGKSGAVVVDVLDDLSATQLTARQTMVPIDGHPNRIWHEIVAHSLYETIKRLELTPSNISAREATN